MSGPKQLLFGVALISFASTGCVTKRTHQALQHELDETRTAMQAREQQRDAQAATLEQALAQEQQQHATCQATAEQLNASIGQLQLQLADERALKDSAQATLADALASRQKMRASIEEMKRALSEMSARRLAAERRIDEYRRVLERFKPLIDAGTLEVKVVDGRMVLVLPTDVLFPSGHAKLSEQGAATIAQVGATLATFTERRFQVEGHTDNVPISTSKYRSNWELASARAVGVVRALLSTGVDPDAVSAASYGEYRPTAPNDSDEGRAQNRRIEIAIVPDLSDLPGFDELNELARPGTRRL